MTMKTLFLNPPSFDGFDGGAGSRYQARREIRSFWYPTWLAQPAAMVPNSKLVDAPAHGQTVEEVVAMAGDYELAVLHTSTPSFDNDCKIAEALKEKNPQLVIGMVGAHVSVNPDPSIRASKAIDFVANGEFDYVCVEIAEGKPLAEAKADVNARENEWEQTPLIFAASANRASAITALIKLGADPIGSSIEEHDMYIKTEIPKWIKMARDAGIEPQ